jgi:hypothetical protein
MLDRDFKAHPAPLRPSVADQVTEWLCVFVIGFLAVLGAAWLIGGLL